MNSPLRRAGFASIAVAILACEGAPPPRPLPPPVARVDAPPIVTEAPPLGELPRDVRPQHYTLVLDVDPQKERFAGTVEIAVDLDKPRTTVWMHALGLHSKGASVRPAGRGVVSAILEQVNPSGLAALHVREPVGPGRVTIHVDYDAPFGTRSEGLYHVTQAGKPYAFTQFEAVFARRAFPSFDEPGFKTPFDVTVFVPHGLTAIGNTHVLETRDVGGLERTTFATTEPLPTYLVALAVGALDVVNGPPVPADAARSKALPLRGVAAHGRGPELAFAMAHTGEILGGLERYFGVAYPYDKLDVIAAPEKLGAMENAGAVMFREYLLLVNERTTTLDQRRAFFGVVSHELAHQWFGDLVTMRWWDDTWLNEAFATWMGNKLAGELRPELHQDVTFLSGIQNAMTVDALVSSRQIRQPVVSTDDIENAFDAITYFKGGGVLAMFERYLSPPTFQRGVQLYLGEHRFGSASADDLLGALSRASKTDVTTPFRTFLEQPGVPLVEGEVVCAPNKARLHLKQSRYLPLGSTGDANRSWQIPVCAKVPIDKDVKEVCTLLTTKEGDLDLGTSCPAWVHPNAEGAGYYRFLLDREGQKRLADKGLNRLTARDRLSFVNSVHAGFARGNLATGEAMASLVPLASDADRFVALAPGQFAESVGDWFDKDADALAGARAFADKLYEPVYKALGWDAKKGEADDRTALRQAIVGELVRFAKAPGVRKEGAARGRAYLGFGGDGALHPDAVDPNLVGFALAAAVEETGAPFFDALLVWLGRTDDEVLRDNLLFALGSATRPELASRARELSLDPRIAGNVWLTVLETQLSDPSTRDAAWEFVRGHVEALVARPSRAARLLRIGSHFCDVAHADELGPLFAPYLAKMGGGPRELTQVVEGIHLCAARRAAQETSARLFFSTKRAGTAALGPKLHTDVGR